METKTNTRGANLAISTQQIEKYTQALKNIAQDAGGSAGSKVSANKYVTNLGVSHYTIGVLKQLDILVTGVGDGFRWNTNMEVDHDLVTKVILAIRTRQNNEKSRDRDRKSDKSKVSQPHDVNKVIASKLADKSKANAKSKGLLDPPEANINLDTRVVRFDTPTEVRINNVVTMQNVNALVFTTDDEGKRIIITASIGDSEVFVKMPNKPLQMYDRYHPGKQSSYIITTQQ